jgi:hypothetical protein
MSILIFLNQQKKIPQQILFKIIDHANTICKLVPCVLIRLMPPNSIMLAQHQTENRLIKCNIIHYNG